MRTGTLFFIILIILLIIVGVVVYNRSANNSILNVPTNEEENVLGQIPSVGTSTTPATSTISSPKQITVTYDGTSFSPNTITLNKGDTIKFVNNSSKGMWVASDPHPQHTIYPSFDEKSSAGSSGTYSFTFDRVGTWGFHNHQNPSARGTIIVR